MGYTTDFEGQFLLNKPLSHHHRSYLVRFNETRRMKRLEADADLRPDPLRDAVGLPIGREGGYFVGEEGTWGDHSGNDVVNSNKPPEGQPGLWCQWTPNENGTAIEWDGGEKFYYYVEWLEYLIKHFLGMWGYRLNGTVTYQGEAEGDKGSIIVVDNVVTKVPA
jgi:hypothetical protein